MPKQSKIQARIKFVNLLTEVRKDLDKGLERSLFRIGGIALKDMKFSIRSGGKKRKPSRAGSPPRTHEPRKVLKNSMAFEVDRKSFSVSIGPRGSQTDGFARYHEFGGTRKFANPRRHKNGKRIIRREGGSGEIETGRKITDGNRKRTVNGKKVGNTQATIDQYGKRQIVTYGKLFTHKQARRAMQIAEELYGPFIINARFRKRPFAKPTQDKLLPAIPKQFANIIR